MAEEQKETKIPQEVEDRLEAAVEDIIIENLAIKENEKTNLNDKIDFLIVAVQTKSQSIQNNSGLTNLDNNPYVFMLDILKIYKELNSRLEKLEASPFNNIKTITEEELRLHKVEYNNSISVSNIQDINRPPETFTLNNVEYSFTVGGITKRYIRFDKVQENSDFTLDIGDIFYYNKGVCFIHNNDLMSMVRMECVIPPNEGDDFLWLETNYENSSCGAPEKFKANDIYLLEEDAHNIEESLNKLV